MKPCIIPISSAQLACEIYGEGKVTLVIEMGLGAVMAEWQHLAKRLSQRHTVLLYQRAGYGESSVSALARTPGNIASELHQLLQQMIAMGLSTPARQRNVAFAADLAQIRAILEK